MKRTNVFINDNVTKRKDPIMYRIRVLAALLLFTMAGGCSSTKSERLVEWIVPPGDVVDPATGKPIFKTNGMQGITMIEKVNNGVGEDQVNSRHYSYNLDDGPVGHVVYRGTTSGTGAGFWKTAAAGAVTAGVNGALSIPANAAIRPARANLHINSGGNTVEGGSVAEGAVKVDNSPTIQGSTAKVEKGAVTAQGGSVAKGAVNASASAKGGTAAAHSGSSSSSAAKNSNSMRTDVSQQASQVQKNQQVQGTQVGVNVNNAATVEDH